LAEASGDAGGAARKLRQLAAEARELEEALRRRSLSPAEVQRRQERFQTRLLEAANALEERGQERERRAEAYQGGARTVTVPAAPARDEALARELKRRRDEARALPLSPEQKRRLEWYYEQLLAP
jgi:DNA repair exonuclease SbcCD ATPase subunit